MTLNDQPTHYDVLDLSPDASAKDIQEAYLRIKSTYNKDSIALYTLVSTEDRESMLKQLEEAYQVLSHADRRKEYDRCHGLLVLERQAEAMPENHDLVADIVSIDRVPPMETMSSDDILVPPTTAFDHAAAPSMQVALQSSTQTETKNDFHGDPSSTQSLSAWVEHTEPQRDETSNTNIGSHAKSFSSSAGLTIDASLNEEIAREIEWHGTLLKRIRENRRISIEEMSSITKISRTYLQAIETENYPKLPAAVFVRGFITQIAKVLRLPHDKVAPAYLARYFQARPDQKH